MSAQANLPAEVVCLQNISEVTCASIASNCAYGSVAKADCHQSAVFKTSQNTFVSVSDVAEATAYECGMFVNTDKQMAEKNAKARLTSLTGSYNLVPRCQ